MVEVLLQIIYILKCILKTVKTISKMSQRTNFPQVPISASGSKCNCSRQRLKLKTSTQTSEEDMFVGFKDQFSLEDINASNLVACKCNANAYQRLSLDQITYTDTKDVLATALRKCISLPDLSSYGICNTMNLDPVMVLQEFPSPSSPTLCLSNQNLDKTVSSTDLNLDKSDHAQSQDDTSSKQNVDKAICASDQNPRKTLCSSDQSLDNKTRDIISTTSPATNACTFPKDTQENQGHKLTWSPEHKSLSTKKTEITQQQNKLSWSFANTNLSPRKTQAMQNRNDLTWPSKNSLSYSFDDPFSPDDTMSFGHDQEEVDSPGIHTNLDTTHLHARAVSPKLQVRLCMDEYLRHIILLAIQVILSKI